MKKTDSNILLYIVKCLVGLFLGYTLYLFFPHHQAYWALLSIVLVLAPEDADSIKFAFDRMKANMIGSAVGLLLFLLHKPDLLFLCVGAVLTILICWITKIMDASRMALAALLIVSIGGSHESWYVCVERMVSVLIGCIIALAITLVFNTQTRKRLFSIK